MSVQTKERIIRSARKVFSEKGFYNAQISHIVDEAGVARGTFYLYFEGKEDVFREILKGVVDDLKKIIKPIDVSGDIRSQILTNLCGVIRYALNNKDLARIVLYRDRWNENSKIVDEFIRDCIALVKSSLKKGIDMGILSNHNVDVIAIAMVGAVKETIKSLLDAGEVNIEEVCKELLEFGIRGIIKEV